MMPGVSSEATLGRRALGRALLERQLLLRRADLPVRDAVERLLGLQAQAIAPPYYGLWSRLEPFDPHELGRMLTDREAVRMTLMRGTVHLVTVRDALLLRPLVQVVIERGHNGAFGRRMGGADLTELERAAREELDGEARHARLRAARPGAAPRGVGEERAGEVRDARGVDGPLAQTEPLDRRGGPALPGGVRPGVGDGHAELVGADEAPRGVRAAATAPRDLSRRGWEGAVRPARRAAPGSGGAGAGPVPRRVRQRAARPRRPHPDHPAGLSLARDARPRPLREQPAGRRDAARHLLDRARRQAQRDAGDPAVRRTGPGRARGGGGRGGTDGRVLRAGGGGAGRALRARGALTAGGRDGLAHARGDLLREALDLADHVVLRPEDEAVEAEVEYEAGEGLGPVVRGSVQALAHRAVDDRTLHVVEPPDGARAAAGSRRSLVDALRHLGDRLRRRAADRGKPAVGEAPREVEHARLVGADPDADLVRRRRAGVQAAHRVVAALVGDRPLAAPEAADDLDRLLERVNRL